MSIKGFTIENMWGATPKYDEAVEVLEEFAKVYGRKKELKEVLADEKITSLEIRSQFLDKNEVGLRVNDFYAKADWQPFRDKSKPEEAFIKLARLFYMNGEDLYSYIEDYGNYYETKTISLPLLSIEKYVRPPVAFQEDEVFYLGAIELHAEAYKFVDKELQTRQLDATSGIVPQHFNYSAIDANPDVIFQLPKKVRGKLIADQEEWLLHAISKKPKYYRYASDRLKADPDFKLRAYQANPKIKRFLSRQEYQDLKVMYHSMNQ